MGVTAYRREEVAALEAATILTPGAPDANHDGLIDSCLNRSVRFVLKKTTPVYTYAIELTNDVPCLGGELAPAFDSRFFRVTGFRSLIPPLPAGTVVLVNPANPVAGPLLGCAGSSTVGLTIAWHHEATPLAPGTRQLFEIDVDFLPNAPVGVESQLEFVYCLGSGTAPKVTNIITGTDGKSLPLFPRTTDIASEVFIRGDANGDGHHDVSDPIVILSCLFVNNLLCPMCEDAADADDNGVINMTDAIYLLNWRFLTGPQPRAPYPACSRDSGDDALKVCNYNTCP